MFCVFLFGCAVSPFFRPLVLRTAGTKHFKPFGLPISSAVRSRRVSANEKLPLPEPHLCTDQSLTGRRRGGGVKSADVVHMVAIRISATSLCAPVVRFRTGDCFYWQGNNMFMLCDVLCCCVTFTLKVIISLVVCKSRVFLCVLCQFLD